MDRSREARRAATMATSNGLPRRRHRTSSLVDALEDDRPLLRDRPGKKDRDRERDRDRDRLERDRSSRAKRRRGEKYLHGTGHRDDAGEGSSEDESINDDEDEDLDDSPVRYASQQSNPDPMTSSSSPYSTLHRRSYPPPAKVIRTAPTWKPADDVMGVSVPRKARSASTKRSHECWTSGVPVEAIHRQASASPVRPNMPSGSSVIGSPSPAPMSPSSSSISMKKKIKSNGTKPKPPKSASKSPSVIQDDIEIEVAEVLYGLMRQSQDPPKQDPMSNESAKFESRESNRSAAESKSRLSSPVSNSGSVPVQSSQAAVQSLCSSQPHLSVVAPKRKRPRTVSHPEENHTSFAPRNSAISSGSKAESDPVAKHEVRSPGTGKTTETAVPNDGGTINFVNPPLSEATPEQVKLEKDEKTVALETSHGPDVVTAKVEEAASPMMESVDGRVDSATSEAIPVTGGKENRRVEKFEIDLMAPPPQSRLSPEIADVDNRDRRQNELLTIDSQAEPPKSKPDEDAVGKGNDDSNATERKPQSTFLEGESHNRNSKARILDLQFKADKSDALGSSCGVNETKLKQLQPKSAPGKTPRDDVIVDRTGLSSSVPLSMPLPAAWPTGLPPMGYVAPLQGVVSMDGAPMAPAAIQPPGFIFTQPRPRRCGYHCYIAKNILNHQQFTKNYPFWPTPTAGNPLYGSKPYNLNIVPPADLHGNTGGRVGVSCSVQDNGQALSFFPGQPASKDKSGPSTNVIDGAQKKQFFLPQSLPPGAPSNIMQGPAFIFRQQQATAAANASTRTNPASKTSNTAGSSATPASASNPALNVSATVGQAPPPMSFNFPNIPPNETQYLAILGNSPYPFPIPAHVGTAPPYRGGHPQAMPFFNGSFYPSQIIHPSQLQQQPQQPPQSVQIQQQGHQNPSISSASSSSQKQMQNHQQRPQGSSGGNNVGSTNPSLHPSFPAPKSRALHAQQQHEMGGEDSPSTADSRVSRPLHNMGVYGPNFNLPFNPPNFALLTPQAQASLSGPANGSSNSNFGEKKQQQQHQQQPPTQIQHTGPKSGMDPMAPQAFAMSFASLNGATTSGLDFSSMAQNHAILQSLPEAARHNYQIMTAAVQQKNLSSYRGGAEDGKANDANNVDDQRKSLGTNRVTSTSSLGQSITFSRPELVESSVTNNVLDSSARTLNHVPGSTRSSRSSTSNAAPTTMFEQQQQQQQILQLQKQQHYAAAAASRSKNPPTSNGGVYSDHHQHLSSAPSAAAAKFPNALTGLYQGGSPVHSSQWKGSGRATPSQVGSPSMAGATTAPSSSTMKTLSQQQQTSRNAQQGQQTQISFSGGNLKPSSAPPSQGQQGPTGSQTESLPLRVGSPTTSSVSKGAGGSPRTNTSSSTGNKQGPQPSVLSPQQGNKNSSHSLSSQKPSSLSGRNAPSLLGNPHTSSSSVGSKSQLQHSQQQIQQPQLSKQSIQQAQLFFSSPYMQQAAQQQLTSTSSGQQPSGGFYLQRHRPDQHAQQHSKSQVGLTPTSSSSSSGMMTLCPVSLGNSTGTSDPAKAMAAAAAAASNIKGQGILHAAQYAASQAAGGMGFPYVHGAATAVQGKQAEQKQPAGNDNLHASWQPEKKGKTQGSSGSASQR